MAAEGYLDCVLRESGNIPPDLDDPPDGGGDSGGDPPDGGDGCPEATLYYCRFEEVTKYSQQSNTDGSPIFLCDSRTNRYDEWGDTDCFNNGCGTEEIPDSCAGGGKTYYSDPVECDAACRKPDRECEVFFCPLELGEETENIECSTGTLTSLSSHVLLQNPKEKCFIDDVNACSPANNPDGCEPSVCLPNNVQEYTTYAHLADCNDDTCQNNCAPITDPSCVVRYCVSNGAPCDGDVSCDEEIFLQSEGTDKCVVLGDNTITCFDKCDSFTAAGSTFSYKKPPTDGDIKIAHTCDKQPDNSYDCAQSGCEEDDNCQIADTPCTVFACRKTSQGETPPCDWEWDDANDEFKACSSTPDECCSPVQIFNIDSDCCNCDGSVKTDASCNPISDINNPTYDYYTAIRNCMNGCTSGCPNGYSCPPGSPDEGTEFDCDLDCTASKDLTVDNGCIFCRTWTDPDGGKTCYPDPVTGKNECEAGDISCSCPVKYTCSSNEQGGEDCVECIPDDPTADSCTYDNACPGATLYNNDSCDSLCSDPPGDLSCYVCNVEAVNSGPAECDLIAVAEGTNCANDDCENCVDGGGNNLNYFNSDKECREGTRDGCFRSPCYTCTVETVDGVTTNDSCAPEYTRKGFCARGKNGLGPKKILQAYYETSAECLACTQCTEDGLGTDIVDQSVCDDYDDGVVGNNITDDDGNFLFPEPGVGLSFGFNTRQLASLYGVGGVGFLKTNKSNSLFGTYNAFMPVKSEGLRSDLFKPVVHGPIKAAILMNRGAMPYSDIPFGSIRGKHIEMSLNDNLVILMKSCRAADGRPIYRKLLNNIRDYILDGKIEEFNVPRFTETLNRIINAQKSGDYDDTRKEFSFDRVAKPQEALDLVLRKGKPYSHKNYGQRVGERMRLWKTVATDLFKNIPFVKSDGSTTKIPIKKDDSFKFIKDDETEVSGYINDGDFVNFVNDEGQTIRVEVDGEHERAGVISLEVMEKALNLLNDDLEYSLTVETDVSARVEEQYNYNDAHRTAYVLKLKPETILDLPRKNQFVARTSAEYLFETGRKKHTEWLKYKPFPYLVIHVDHEDPIISFFQYATKITFNTKDFTLDTVDNGTMPLYPRRLPWTLIVIPTDRSDLNIYGGKSRYTGYGTRVLNIRMHPDPSRTRTGLDGPHLKTSFASDQRGVAPTRDPQALEYSYDLDKLRDLRRYEVKGDNTELLPRRKGAVRTVLETLRDFNEYYKISDTSRLTWEEVYEKMPNTNLKKLYRECLDWMNVKTKLTMGSVSDNEDIDTLYARPLDQLSNKATAAQQRNFSRFEVGVRINLEKISDPADIPDGPELPEAPDD